MPPWGAKNFWAAAFLAPVACEKHLILSVLLADKAGISVIRVGK